MSPNYSLSQISFDLQRQLIKHFELEVTRDNAKDKVIELSNGSTIRMGSVNQVDSVVGRSYDFIIFDEAALVDGRDAFNVALRPTLDKENSKALFISTPRGRNNWFAEFWHRGFSVMSFQSGHLFEQLIMRIQDFLNRHSMKQEKLCLKQNLTKSIWQTSMYLKVKYGHLIMKNV